MLHALIVSAVVLNQTATVFVRDFSGGAGIPGATVSVQKRASPDKTWGITSTHTTDKNGFFSTNNIDLSTGETRLVANKTGYSEKRIYPTRWANPFILEMKKRFRRAAIWTLTYDECCRPVWCVCYVLIPDECFNGSLVVTLKRQPIDSLGDRPQWEITPPASLYARSRISRRCPGDDNRVVRTLELLVPGSQKRTAQRTVSLFYRSP
jgi:hypothetical protein